jgi:hypothetical protein
MSKIQAELVKATDLSKKRGEDVQDFLARLMVAIAELSDDAWEELTEPARQWYNEAAEAKNAKKKVLPGFPDAEADEESEAEKPATTRRSAKAEDKEEAPPTKPTKAKVGMILTAVTKRGKTVTGKCVEVDEDMVVLDVDGEDQEFTRDRLESLTEAKGTAPEVDEPDEPIKVGVEVKLVNKRGKEFTGKIVEMDEDVVVLDIAGEDMEFARDRVESMTPVGGKAKTKAESEKASTRRGAATADDEGDDKPAEKAKRVSNEGISIGQRIKELIADDLEATVEDIAKSLKKEKIEFKENTLTLNFKDAHKFIEVLRAKKLLK